MSAHVRIVRSLAAAALTLLAPDIAAATTAGPIPAAQLVPHRGELPGFAHARKVLWSTASAAEWAKAGNGSKVRGESEVSYLRRAGFQEGVEVAYLLRPHREAVAAAAVFASAGAAHHELAATVTEALKTFEHANRYRFVVHAIPGSVGLGSAGGTGHAVTGNVFFATGRCVFTVANRIVGASTRTQGERAPVSGAKALYRRALPLCA